MDLAYARPRANDCPVTTNRTLKRVDEPEMLLRDKMPALAKAVLLSVIASSLADLFFPIFY